MLEKSRQARQSALLISPRSPVEPYDELAMFGGRTGLVLPKSTATAEPAASISSAAFDPNPFLLPTPPAHLPGARTPTGREFVPDSQNQGLYFMDEEEELSFDVGAPATWEGLYREVPEPSYSYGASVGLNAHAIGHAGTGAGVSGPANPPGEAMLEDRWSTFMHQYAMTGQGYRP